MPSSAEATSDPLRTDHQRRLRVVLIAAIWVYTAAHFALSGVKQPLHNFYGDFLASFPSWQASVALGRMDLYNGSLSEEWSFRFRGEREPVWHYGPVEHLVTLPLFAFPTLKSAYVAWLFVNYAFLAGIAILAVRLFDPGHSALTTTATLAALLNFNPLYEALNQRTIEILELLLILIAYALWRKGRLGWCGVVIGLAAMTKFLPLIFLPYFVVKRKWRALAGALAAIVPIALLTEAVLGWKHSGILIQLLKDGPLHSELNQSFSGAIVRLIDWTKIPVSGAIISQIAILICLTGLSWLFLVTRECVAAHDLEWGTLIIAMVLLPPHNEQYYFLFLLFPYLAIFARRIRLRDSHHSSWFLFLISFILVAAPIPLAILAGLTGVNVFHLYLSAGIPFLGAAILGWIGVRELAGACRVTSG
ncbi:MAG TPA: glycosyltransferase family 87 protein [Thermoanaerobaculia bacterium]|nr:glycosyltransferase family 87 protein [Thermoanaerobaculia bacterium]